MGAGVLLRFLVFYLDRNMKIKGKAYPKKVYVTENLFSSANMFFEHTKLCQSLFYPTRPFWPVSCHSDSNG